MAERRIPVSGDVDTTVAQKLQDELLLLVNATNDDLVLDCTDLAFIDSVGISAVIHVQRLMEIQGRRFRIENLHGMARRAFDILGLTDMVAGESKTVLPRARLVARLGAAVAAAGRVSTSTT
jgi:anti-anti-sigma factor